MNRPALSFSIDGDFALEAPLIARRSDEIGPVDWVICALKATAIEQARAACRIDDKLHNPRVVLAALLVTANRPEEAVAALAEARYGAGQGVKNVVYLTMSTGIGGGLVLDGQLYTGAHHAAGEIG
ncbi:MAG: ROK family protein, partial [Salinicola sp.]|uniref:ROK family protein n=1 Tax=Salinicola sp. TaxID=1978524 RepID=UPI001D88B2E5